VSTASPSSMPCTAAARPQRRSCTHSTSWSARKANLARLLARKPAGIVFNEHTDEDGATVFRHACRFGFEGIVSKRVTAPYRSGPSRNWIKVKNPDSAGQRRLSRHRPCDQGHASGRRSRRGNRTILRRGDVKRRPRPAADMWAVGDTGAGLREWGRRHHGSNCPGAVLDCADGSWMDREGPCPRG
jgi:hypothetical protein